jgi:hypothetical protein
MARGVSQLRPSEPPQDLWCPQTWLRRVFSVSLRDYLVSY